MKYILICFLSLGIIISESLAQEELLNMSLDPDTEMITYQEVVEVEGTKDELFNRGSTWLRIFYANPMSVSRVRDQASGLIRGQHQVRVNHTDEDGNKVESEMVLYSFKIEFKDNRYRYTVYDFLVKRISRYPLENWLNKQDPDYSQKWDDYLKQIDAYIREEWVPSLKANMKPEVEKVEEEW
jgi:hypothetical protein